jgi:hypothetical protein
MRWPSLAMSSPCLSEGFRSKTFFFEKKNQKTSVAPGHGRYRPHAHGPD